MLVSERVEHLLLGQFPEAILESREISQVSSHTIKTNEIVYICRFLRDHPELDFDYLMSLTAVDWPERLEVVYHLYSIAYRHYVTLRVNLDKEDPVVPSVTGVWRAADWQEREVYDMFGIEFEGHPDLRRILLEPDWQGFPLRKDYVEK